MGTSFFRSRETVEAYNKMRLAEQKQEPQPEKVQDEVEAPAVEQTEPVIEPENEPVEAPEVPQEPQPEKVQKSKKNKNK